MRDIFETRINGIICSYIQTRMLIRFSSHIYHTHLTSNKFEPTHQIIVYFTHPASIYQVLHEKVGKKKRLHVTRFVLQDLIGLEFVVLVELYICTQKMGAENLFLILLSSSRINSESFSFSFHHIFK